MLNEQQRSWVGEAIDSSNPLAYVREAVRAGEFDLARAVCVEWGRDPASAFDAMRVATMVDQAETQAVAAQPQPEVEPVKPAVLLQTLEEYFPDMPAYEEKMVEMMGSLGDNHPLVVEARSGDPETAVRGIIGIYEIARASTHTLAETRAEVKNDRRAAATAARKKAVVSTSEASPSPSESPRAKKLGPGLTLEQLDQEWAANT
jgi:hypothetical protein